MMEEDDRAHFSLQSILKQDKESKKKRRRKRKEEQVAYFPSV